MIPPFFLDVFDLFGHETPWNTMKKTTRSATDQNVAGLVSNGV